MDSLVAEIERVRLAAAARAVAIAGGTVAPSTVVKLPDLYPAQQRMLEEAKRFNVVCCGRRSGKTFLGAYLALRAAIAGDPVGWFSPSYKMLLEVWRDIQRPIKDLAARVNNTERRIEFDNGGIVEAWTLENEDAGRSRKYKLAIIDEAAAAPHLKLSWEEAIRPTLTDLEGSAWFLSTPKGLNFFFDLHNRGIDESYPDWMSWQMPSSVNPYLPANEILIARDELPALTYQQEYEATFIQADGSVFRNVESNLTAQPTTQLQHMGHLIVGGIDWGRAHDFTVLSLICCHCRREVFLDRFNKVGWDFQRGRLLQQLELWGVKYCKVETNSIGGPNLEAIRQAAPRSISIGGFETTVKSKGPLILGLALALEKSTLQWLADPVGKHELLAYEATVTESGYTRYGAPEGGFDDTVIARALALKAARAYLNMPEQEETGPEPPEYGMLSDVPGGNPASMFARRKKQSGEWNHTDEYWGKR